MIANKILALLVAILGYFEVVTIRCSAVMFPFECPNGFLLGILFLGGQLGESPSHFCRSLPNSNLALGRPYRQSTFVPMSMKAGKPLVFLRL